jgi:hypothetical protein
MGKVYNVVFIALKSPQNVIMNNLKCTQLKLVALHEHYIWKMSSMLIIITHFQNFKTEWTLSKLIIT